MHIALVVGLLAAGGVVTSFAEYHFKYNLYDYITEGIKKVLGIAKKVEADAKAVEKKL